MGLGTNLFLAYVIYFISVYIRVVFSKQRRIDHRKKRSELEAMRNIAVKSPEQQKAFLDLKYPKTPPFVWSWKNVGKTALKLGIMVAIFFAARWLWKTYVPFDLALWHTVIIMVLLPVLLNRILKKYKLEQDDILVFLK